LIPAAASLALFAWLLTLHPSAAGRTYAAYGGMYIAVALLWLRFVDGVTLTPWDVAGASIALVGMAVIALQPAAASRPADGLRAGRVMLAALIRHPLTLAPGGFALTTPADILDFWFAEITPPSGGPSPTTSTAWSPPALAPCCRRRRAASCTPGGPRRPGGWPR
jgi:hypothetical protein